MMSILRLVVILIPAFGQRKFKLEDSGQSVETTENMANLGRTGDFAITTDTDENVFVRDGELWIKPSLQDENLINKNTVIDLTKQGICTSKAWSDCHAVTNTTNGTIVNPVKSARINTKKGASIQYGEPISLPLTPLRLTFHR